MRPPVRSVIVVVNGKARGKSSGVRSERHWAWPWTFRDVLLVRMEPFRSEEMLSKPPGSPNSPLERKAALSVTASGVISRRSVGGSEKRIGPPIGFTCDARAQARQSFCFGLDVVTAANGEGGLKALYGSLLFAGDSALTGPPRTKTFASVSRKRFRGPQLRELGGSYGIHTASDPAFKRAAPTIASR